MIRCAICKKPIIRREVWHSIGDDKYTFIVHCHGATDRMEIYAHDMPRESEIVEAVAFTKGLIE